MPAFTSAFVAKEQRLDHGHGLAMAVLASFAGYYIMGMRSNTPETAAGKIFFSLSWLMACILLLPFMNTLCVFLSSINREVLAVTHPPHFVGYFVLIALDSVTQIDNFLLLAGPVLVAWPFLSSRFGMDRSLKQLSLALAFVCAPLSLLPIMGPEDNYRLIWAIDGIRSFAIVLRMIAVKMFLLWLLFLLPRFVLYRPRKQDHQ